VFAAILGIAVTLFLMSLAIGAIKRKPHV